MLLACSRTSPSSTKDLIGIPWMLAFALRADGWFLRQDIIWSKPNPMPESVRDRCTKAHEYLFLLSKGPRLLLRSGRHHSSQRVSPNTHARLSQDVQNQIGSQRVPGKTNGNDEGRRTLKLERQRISQRNA
jgi:DNA modification methylase